MESLQQEHQTVPEVKAGVSAGLKVKEHVREGDKVFQVKEGPDRDFRETKDRAALSGRRGNIGTMEITPWT